MMKAQHKREFARDLQDGAYELTPGGVLFSNKGVLVGGEYIHGVNGGDWRTDHNLIVDEGLLYLLGASLGATAKISAWYLALFSGNVNPAAGWTAATFTATATEVTSNTEGYSNVTRPVWTPGTPAAGAIDNMGSLATFNVVCTTPYVIYGAALLSSNVKGGTSGTLASAGRFDMARTLYNNDVFQVGYRLTLYGY